MAKQAVVLVAALALAAGAAAQIQGTTLRGYTFQSNAAAPYLNISRDLMAIRKALDKPTPDYAAAMSIYMDGLNAKQVDGTPLSLRELATSPKGANPFWAEYSAYFGTPNWIDELLTRAFGGISPFLSDPQRVQTIVKTGESALQFAIMMNQFDEAVNAAKAKKVNDAVAAIDKAWAIFVGGEPQTGLWTVTMKRANEYGTKVSCDMSQAAQAVQKAFFDAQRAARTGDVAGIEAAKKAVQRAMAAVFVQATITYAHEMYLDTQGNLSVAEHQAEAYSFFRTIAPLVYAANKNASEALDFWLFPANPAVPEVDLKVARAFASAYKGMGITRKDVGEFGKKQPELKCETVRPGSGPGGLLTSTTVTGPMRPGGGAAAPAPKPAGRRLFRLF